MLRTRSDEQPGGLTPGYACVLRAVLASVPLVLAGMSILDSTIATATAAESLSAPDSAAPPTKSSTPHSGWYLNVAPALVHFETRISPKVGGIPLPDAGANASDNVLPGLGIGYFLTPNLSLLALVGLPPETTMSGTGVLSGLTLGKVTYGPAIPITLNYHFRGLGAFQPFAGVGVNYTIILHTRDAAVVHLKVKNAWSPVLRVGFDYMVTDHSAFVFAAQKLFLSTSMTGTISPAIPALGGAPTSANVALNPWIFYAGLAYRF